MEISTKDGGKTIKHMAKVTIYTVMDPSTRESGRKISKMEKELNSGLMVLVMKVTTLMERNMALVSFYGQTEVLTLGSSLITISKEAESISGLMIDRMMESGRIIRCMVLGYSNGLMVGNMRENTLTMSNQVKELFRGLMVGSMWGCGIMGSNMG